MDEPASSLPLTSSSVPAAPRRHLRVIGIALAVILVLAAIVYALYAYSPFGSSMQAAWSIATMPSELKNATFISDGDGTTTLYRIHGLSFVAEPLTGNLVSAEQEANGTAQIVHTGTGYVLMVNGKQAYATTSPLLGVSASADGTKAVIAAQFGGKETGPYGVAPSIHPYLWTAVLLHLDGNGSPLVLGSGIAPLYTDATHILRVAPVGLVSVNMTNGAVSITAPHPIPVTIAAVLVSPDRTHMAWFDPESHSFMVYSVGAGTTDKVAEIKDINPKTSYALGNDALYIMRVKGGVTQILKQGFSSAGSVTQTGSVPGNLHVTRMLIGSL
jgi:hypothetical protein